MVPAVPAAFPPTGDPDTHPGRILPTAVRRAVAFIDAHPDQPLTPADIAAATGSASTPCATAYAAIWTPPPPATCAGSGSPTPTTI
ncbi:hypothetical protein ACFQFC_35635 [Amorphoplanes digitatis]|uniref:Uncharacterized protein n=1 Tax=Actinoplanes digitatis TaxID=1868 RepID=A0A7W7HVJ5_9ACTN|nr:helix-turn-helix transcriptional regulator [Actinoplanes digitatis]MBB4761493.1 hypothetical protein [Actinoplanes digitatis]